MKLFNRIWQLKVKTKKIDKVYSTLNPEESGIRIEFNSESSVNQVPNNGDITLYNIPTKDIAAICTDFMKSSAAMNPSTVELQAGYDKTMGIILYGSIYEAVGNFQPSINNVKLKIMNNTPTHQSDRMVISLSNNAMFRDICGAIAKKANLNLDYDTRVPNREVNDFSYAGNLTQQIENLRSLYKDINIFLDKKKLVVRVAKLDNKQKVYEITESTGLLGTPVPKPQGCVFETYMMPFVYASDYIKLKSIKIPALDGYYRVQSIRHKGSSHSDDWLSDFTCIKA